MRRIWKRAKPKLEKRFKINDLIKVPEVSVINENGENIGIISTLKAREMALELGMDLVEVNPVAEPPVCKIMNYGQFKYEQEKKAHKQKIQQKKIDTKGVRLSVRISEHDFNVRIEQATKFLLKGDKLKIELLLKGREKAHPEKAREIINVFVQKLQENKEMNLISEQDLTMQGGKFIMILVNKI
jgi:translation initiation factor IF-3